MVNEIEAKEVSVGKLIISFLMETRSLADYLTGPQFLQKCAPG